MEIVIATAEDSEELEAKLDHLHDLLRQPYEQLQRCSPFVAFFALCQVFLSAQAVAGIVEGETMPFGALIDLGLSALGIFYCGLVLFWVGSVGDAFRRTKSKLNRPKVGRTAHNARLAACVPARLPACLPARPGADAAAALVWLGGVRHRC